jgi:hypothetical protein
MALNGYRPAPTWETETCSCSSWTAIEVSTKQAAEAYALAEAHEANPRSVWGYVQGLTRLSQRTPWQDGRFSLDQAASRLIAMVN